MALFGAKVSGLQPPKVAKETAAGFETAFAKFMRTAQATVKADYDANWYDVGITSKTPPRLSFTRGRRYIHLMANRHGLQRIFCFVDSVTGDVLSVTAEKNPGRGYSSGNVHDAQHGCGRMLWTRVY